MFHLCGFLEDIDPAGADVNITALADQVLNINGDDLYVPTLNQIVAVTAGLENTAAPRAYLVAPSIREIGRLQVTAVNAQAAAAIEPDTPHKMQDFRESPIPLTRGEALNALINSNPAAAQDQWLLVWLADGPIRAVTGAIRTVRATGATTCVANAWTNGNITFDEDLPAGRYQVVGMKAISAGLVAARLAPRGGGPRPGVLGVDAIEDNEWPGFRLGKMGVFMEFVHDNPPSVDYLSISADTAEIVYLDLIKVA